MIKYILLIIFLVCGVAKAQQMPFSFWGADTLAYTILPMVYPVLDPNPIFNADSGYIWSPYNIYLNWNKDSIILNYINYTTVQKLQAFSAINDGRTFINRKVLVNPPSPMYADEAFTEVSEDFFRAVWHSKDGSDQWWHYIRIKSNDRGVTWTPDSLGGRLDTVFMGSRSNQANKRVGEDITTCYNILADSFYVYFRDSTTGEGFIPGISSVYPLRTIALSRTKDMVDFTSREVVIPKTRANHYNPNSKDYHVVWNNMSVISTRVDEYWGFANIIQLSSTRQENQPTPTGRDDIVETRLYFSPDGYRWYDANDSNAFISIHDSIKQVFSLPVVNGDSVFIYAIENNLRHNSNATYTATVPNKKWNIRLYTISVDDLRRFKPVEIKVNIGLVTNYAGDPYCDTAFIRGYESVGGVWAGGMQVQEWADSYTLMDIVPPYAFEETLFPNVITDNAGFMSEKTRMAFLYNTFDIQYVTPAGSNRYKLYSYLWDNSNPGIAAGAGYDSNMTGYSCEFWSRDPFSTGDSILWMLPTGITYQIDSVILYSNGNLGFSLADGDSANPTHFEEGMKVRFNITGSDIDTLPGLATLVGASNGVYLEVNTTQTYTGINSSGTVDVWQPVTGTVKTGTTDGRTMIGTGLNWSALFNYFPITLTGVTGYSPNPNYTHQVLSGAWNWQFNKGEIGWVGHGNYAGGGKIWWYHQSQTTPYIAGMLSYIRYMRQCSWWEARYCARMTGSEGGIRNEINGYGTINVLAAINYSGSIPADPY